MRATSKRSAGTVLAGFSTRNAHQCFTPVHKVSLEIAAVFSNRS
jgi:hypothetical protein